MHTNHSSAAKRAEEALAELALVRETQQALTKQVTTLTPIQLMSSLGKYLPTSSWSCKCIVGSVLYHSWMCCALSFA